jgi:hypothetical protein
MANSWKTIVHGEFQAETLISYLRNFFWICSFLMVNDKPSVKFVDGL